MQFRSFKQREEVLGHSRELRATEFPSSRGLFTNRWKRSGLTLLLKQFRDDGKWAKLQHDKLVTEDRTLTLDLKLEESQRLEPRDRPEARKSQRLEPKDRPEARGVPETGTQRQT